MQALNVFFLFFMSFFLLQSMDVPNDLGKVNNEAYEAIEKMSLKRVNSLNSVSDSVNYPIEKIAYKKIAQILSPSQLVALACDVVEREDSPPELRKKRKNRFNGAPKICGPVETKKQLLKDQKKIDLKLKEHLEQLSKEKARKMPKAASESDLLLATLRKIHVKKDEESSEEEN